MSREAATISLEEHVAREALIARLDRECYPLGRKMSLVDTKDLRALIAEYRLAQELLRRAAIAAVREREGAEPGPHGNPDYCCDNGNFGEAHECQKQDAPDPAEAMRAKQEPVEVRNDDAGGIDEIIVRGGNTHIERMSNDGWFLGVDGDDGSNWQFWFGSKNRKSHVEFRHTEHVSASELAALKGNGEGNA